MCRPYCNFLRWSQLVLHIIHVEKRFTYFQNVFVFKNCGKSRARSQRVSRSIYITTSFIFLLVNVGHKLLSCHICHICSMFVYKAYKGSIFITAKHQSLNLFGFFTILKNFLNSSASQSTLTRCELVDWPF